MIGHSYGGNRARLFGGDLLLKGLRADALITIDPIDWERCQILDPSAYCHQSKFVLSALGNIPSANQLSYAQTRDKYLRGYGIGNSAVFMANEDHGSIDDSKQVHKEIREFLKQLLPEAENNTSNELAGTLWKIEDDVCGQNMWSYYSLITFLPEGKIKESSGLWRLKGKQLVIDGARDLNIEQMTLTLQDNQMNGKARFGVLPGRMNPQESCVRLVKLAQDVPASLASAAIPKSGTIEGIVVGKIDGPSTITVVIESKGTAYQLLLVSREHEAKTSGGDVTTFGTRVKATYTGLTKSRLSGYEGIAAQITKLSSPTVPPQPAQPATPDRPKQSLGQTLKSGIRDAFKDVLKPRSDPPATPNPVEPRGNDIPVGIPNQADWNSFWEAFRIAVQKRDRRTLVALMANPFEAVSAGLYTPSQWLEYLDQSGGWSGMDDSLKAGIRANGTRKGRPSKISRDKYLIFMFGQDGKWRWAGVGGD